MKDVKVFKTKDKIESFEENFLTKTIYDFQTPVLAQINALDLFLSIANPKINNEEKELLELTLNSCQIMQNLFDIFLLESKLETEEIFLEYEKFDFVEIIKEIIENLNILLKYSKIEFETQMPESIILTADKSKIEKVLTNLIINTINTSFKGSKGVIKITKQNSKIDFQIKSNSKYVEPHVTDELFKKNKKYFSQYSKSSISLGLYVASRIIQAHYGSIWAKSYINNTNIFGFLLPVNSCVNC